MRRGLTAQAEELCALLTAIQQRITDLDAISKAVGRAGANHGAGATGHGAGAGGHGAAGAAGGARADETTASRPPMASRDPASSSRMATGSSVKCGPKISESSVGGSVNMASGADVSASISGRAAQATKLPPIV